MGEGLDIGTILATLRLVDEMTPALQQAASKTSEFAETVESASTPTTALSGAMTSVANSATEAAVNQVALGTATKSTGLATTEAAVATTALSGATLDAKTMFAQMVAQANADYDAKKAVTAATGELTLSQAALSVATESVAYALGLVAIAFVAFGPRIWELIGGWEGLKDIMAETGELFADLTNIIEPFTDHVLHALYNGITAPIQALQMLGGAIVDFVVDAAELTGVTVLFERIRDVIGALAAEGALADLADDVDSLSTSLAGLNAQPLSFGIDPTDIDAINKWNNETDRTIAQMDPLNGLNDTLRQRSDVIVQELSPAMLRQIGVQVELTAAEKKHIEQMREMEVVGEAQLITASKQVVTFDAMREALEAMQSPLTITSETLKAFNADVDFNDLRVQLEAFNSVLDQTSVDALAASANTTVSFDDMREQLEALEGGTQSWQASVESLAGSFLMLGSIFGGTTGSILNFIGTALNGFLTLNTAIGTISTTWSKMMTSFSTQGFSFSTLLGGISSIIGAAGSAIQVFTALGAAIKRAFTSEETELVNPNRDLFTSQFIGAETDPFQAIANSTIQAAMSVYGVDWDTAWAQYAEPLIRNLQDADTYAEFKNAQLALGELFRQAGVTLDIYNEAGIATQYRSGVFDSGYAIQPITSTTDLGALQQQYTTQAQTNVQGAYAGGTYGGTYFQSGSMAPMGGSGLCIHIENLYVGGSTGTQQAASFFDALFAYVSGGGEALSRWRELNCAAGAA